MEDVWRPSRKSAVAFDDRRNALSQNEKGARISPGPFIALTIVVQTVCFDLFAAKA